MICKYSNSKSSGVRGMECMFLHTKYVKQKCDACNFNSNKDKVKIHNIKEQSCTLCHKVDKIIEHKRFLLKKFI